MLDQIKKTIAPPYNASDLYSIFFALFIMVAIPITVMEVNNSRDNRSSASVFEDLSNNTNSEIKVKIILPKTLENVSGAVDVSVTATYEAGTISQLIINSDTKVLATINNPSTSSKFTTSFSWDTTKERNGTTNLFATAINSTGQKNDSNTVKLIVANIDTTKPSVSFNRPNEGSYLSGDNYFVKINADDNLGLGFVELSLDNKIVKTFSKALYEFRVDLTALPPGNHLLSARAVDLSNNETVSRVTVYRGLKSINN